ncbi:DUF2007 domain-containing protein [Leptospira semungkisensis]|uniref:DUF2007 domain-containing protein n=1 Tax=Leptospira semungkisensis TaxID=2484985 RepID=A0A4R9G7M4_9LEPT|nr:DUF2007 domain-containing protein [Leptospira semungkisensis]TGK07628.1 DUF2007 domain-containing protein [Leptospira semungkisensis]
MKKLFETNDPIEAGLMESLLSSEDIAYIKKGDEANVLRGVLPPNDTLIAFYVGEEDYEGAEILIQSLRMDP